MNIEVTDTVIDPAKVAEQELQETELNAPEGVGITPIETDNQAERIEFEFAVNGLETPLQGTVTSYSGTCQTVNLALNPNPFNNPAVVQVIKTMYGLPVEQQVTLG